MLLGHYRSAITFRTFILSAIRGEFKNRFIRSKVGALWHFLNPLAMAATYAFVLSRVLGARLGDDTNVPGAYAIYLIAGILAWNFFAEMLQRCLTIFIEYGSTMKKIAFPRVALPLIVLGGALLGHALLFLAALLVLTGIGHFPSIEWLFLPLGSSVIIIFAMGLGILLGTFNVFARDIGQVMAIVVTFWFWMTPIVYPKDMLHGAALRVVDANPMTPIIEFFQDIMLYKQMPDFLSLAYPAAIGVCLLIVSLLVFRRASGELVDAL